MEWQLQSFLRDAKTQLNSNCKAFYVARKHKNPGQENR